MSLVFAQLGMPAAHLSLLLFLVFWDDIKLESGDGTGRTCLASYRLHHSSLGTVNEKK